jgi:hypothetical protein
MPTSSDDRIRIAEAQFPKPFTGGLEFNAPAHGTWNIVHIGFKIPRAHQIYICADNCMRGVVMTAAEMGELSRFSSVILEEDDMVFAGRLEESTIEGVTDVLNSLPEMPPVVIVFPVCVHKFMGCDINFIYDELSKRFPDVKFVRGFMDPVMQKRGTTPDQRLRKAMFDIIPEGEKDGSVTVIGCDMPLSEDNDIRILLEAKGIKIRDEASCKTLEDYYSLGCCDRLICSYPAGLLGTTALAKRIDKPLTYMPFTFGYDAIDSALNEIGLTPDPDGRTSCDKAASDLKMLIGDNEIAIDYTAVPRPLSLARFLISRGFNVKKIYLDAMDPDEKEDFEWLVSNAPDTMLCATMHVKGRRLGKNDSDKKILAIGQKAAWFEGTEYFVNMIEGGGLYGYAGIKAFLKLMEDAFIVPKDTEDIIPRKGLGCCCVL